MAARAAAHREAAERQACRRGGAGPTIRGAPSSRRRALGDDQGHRDRHEAAPRQGEPPWEDVTQQLLALALDAHPQPLAALLDAAVFLSFELVSKAAKLLFALVP